MTNDLDDNDTNLTHLAPAPNMGNKVVIEPGDLKNCVDLERFGTYPDHTIRWDAPVKGAQNVLKKWKNLTLSHTDIQSRKSYHLVVEVPSEDYTMSVYQLETDTYTMVNHKGLPVRKVTQHTRTGSNPFVVYRGKKMAQPNFTYITRYVPYKLIPETLCLGSSIGQTYTEDTGESGSLIYWYEKVMAIGEKKCIKTGCYHTVKIHFIRQNSVDRGEGDDWFDLKTGLFIAEELKQVKGPPVKAEMVYIDQK